MGPRPSDKHQIDRIDNDIGYYPYNCRWATKEQNTQNRGGWSKKTSSNYKGVSKNGGGWVAKITKNKQDYYLGTFKTEIEAAQAYDKKALELHGEFAVINFNKGDRCAP
jgi:hypothetical protein